MPDHIGLEVNDLERFCRDPGARGIVFDVPYGRSASGIGYHPDRSVGGLHCADGRVARPLSRRIAFEAQEVCQEEESIRINGCHPQPALCPKLVQGHQVRARAGVPDELGHASAPMKSARAVTTASRLVFAPVKRMASASSFAGISIVVFTK